MQTEEKGEGRMESSVRIKDARRAILRDCKHRDSDGMHELEIL